MMQEEVEAGEDPLSQHSSNTIYRSPLKKKSVMKVPLSSSPIPPLQHDNGHQYHHLHLHPHLHLHQQEQQEQEQQHFDRHDNILKTNYFSSTPENRQQQKSTTENDDIPCSDDDDEDEDEEDHFGMIKVENKYASHQQKEYIIDKEEYQVKHYPLNCKNCIILDHYFSPETLTTNDDVMAGSQDITTNEQSLSLHCLPLDSESEHYVTYQLQPNDSLSKLAIQFDTTEEKIRIMNNITGSDLDSHKSNFIFVQRPKGLGKQKSSQTVETHKKTPSIQLPIPFNLFSRSSSKKNNTRKKMESHYDSMFSL